jgi:vacuolar-type H+-ATPase subunit I/STV1
MTRKKTRARKDEDPVEKLEKEVRQLKALNRSLQKRLKKIDRQYAKTLELEEESKEEELKKAQEPNVSHKVPCEHCGKGYVEETNLLGRVFLKCTTCDFKGRKK